MKSILQFKEDGYQETYVLPTLLPEVNAKLEEINHVVCYSDDLATFELPTFQITNIPNLGNLMVMERDCRSYYFDTKEALIIDPKIGHIQFSNHQFSFTRTTLKNPLLIPIFVNGKRQQDSSVSISIGDQILIEDVIFIIQKQTIKVIGNHQRYTTSLPLQNPRKNHLRDFPNYRRSPRVIKNVSNEKVDLLSPPEEQKMSKGQLATIIITPLISIAATIAMGVLMSRGPYVYIALATSLISTTMSIVKYFSDTKEIKETNQKKQTAYEAYLLRTRKKLEQVYHRELESITYHYPTMKELSNQVQEYSSRIYEKDVTDDDFLTISMGTKHSRSNIQIKLDTNELEIEKNPLLDEAREIKQQYQYIDHKPVVIDLKKAHVGLVGDKEDIHQQIKQMLTQLTFFQSYHDVEIIMLYNESYKDTFEYVRWYPHVRISAINVKGNIYQEKVRDQVLGSLAQILKQRKDKRDERKSEGVTLPHYVIFIDDYFLVMNHSIMEYLQEESTNLGFTLVFSAKQRADLPENIQTVILIEDKHTNCVLLNEGTMINRQIDSYQIDGIDLETMARNLAVLQHQKGMQSQIPESITFFDLYQVETPKELDVLQRWQENQSHKSLSVPLGVRAKDDIVYLDLHEKAHGPHGLVAGTTGSGKSEIIQSYILSLAINFHPHEVGFLLIDYKGGGMANLFNNLPHLLGTITNLDGSESMRALASIKSELKRRQHIFNEHGVNNIIKYNKLFKAGKAKEPLPTLFLISDEFAELKKEQPEFMSELVSVARIGRTLGIKLILATQKPSGVVDDQIWSNSKFKLALKVQNEGDSKEVIKTPDAAYITQAGRAYLQVGNNEIYELFQSAWSGANYHSEDDEPEINNIVYRINDIGQAEIVNRDLSGSDSDEQTVSLTQLDVTINHIHDVHDSLDALSVKKPWLSSLEQQIVSPYIPEVVEDVSTVETIDLSCPIGMVDIPEEQKQSDFTIDFVKDGNVAIFASSGFGKSFTIGTMMLTLAVKNNPKLLQYYILDLGNSALIPYVNLPHTADYMNFDATEKMAKFVKLIDQTVKERKQLFANAMVQNYDTYNQMNADNPLPAIMVWVDNYDVIKELPSEVESFITRLSRDGAGLGIYVVLSATRTSAVRYATLNNFKVKIAQYMYDKMEATTVVGRSQYELPEVKGRALVKLENINIMQVYTPFDFEDNVMFIKELKTYIEKLKASYTGKSLLGIPILPEIFTSYQFSEYEKEEGVKTALGLCVNDVRLVDAGIKGAPYIIIGPQKTGKTNALELCLQQREENGRHYIFDAPSMELIKYKGRPGIQYVTTDDEMQDFIQDLFTEVEVRKEDYAQAMATSPVSSQEFFANYEPFNIYIDMADEFVARLGKKAAPFYEILKECDRLGIKVIATVTPGKLKGIDAVTKYFKAALYGLVLGNQGAVSIFPLSHSKETPSFGYGLIFDNGSHRRVLLPKVVEQKEN